MSADVDDELFGNQIEANEFFDALKYGYSRRVDWGAGTWFVLASGEAVFMEWPNWDGGMDFWRHPDPGHIEDTKFVNPGSSGA